MEEIDVFKSFRESVDGVQSPIVDEREAARLKLIADHKAWLKKIKKEHPSPYHMLRTVGRRRCQALFQSEKSF